MGTNRFDLGVHSRFQVKAHSDTGHREIETPNLLGIFFLDYLKLRQWTSFFSDLFLILLHVGSGVMLAALKQFIEVESQIHIYLFSSVNSS